MNVAASEYKLFIRHVPLLSIKLYAKPHEPMWRTLLETLKCCLEIVISSHCRSCCESCNCFTFSNLLAISSIFVLSTTLLLNSPFCSTTMVSMPPLHRRVWQDAAIYGLFSEVTLLKKEARKFGLAKFPLHCVWSAELFCVLCSPLCVWLHTNKQSILLTGGGGNDSTNRIYLLLEQSFPIGCFIVNCSKLKLSALKIPHVGSIFAKCRQRGPIEQKSSNIRAN